MTDATAKAQANAPAGEDTRAHYHPIGILFHWTIAVLVVFQLWWGWHTAGLAPGYAKLEAYELHALIGIFLFVLALLRASWRMIEPFVLPKLEKPEDLPEWQRLAAELTHLALYALMFVLPLSGWLMFSTAAYPEQIIALPYGLEWPILPFVAEQDFTTRAQWEQAAETVHLLMVLAIIFLIALHVGAALKHHFIDQDDVLARMIPILSRGKARSRRSAKANR